MVLGVSATIFKGTRSAAVRLSDFDAVVINTSGGKDSQTAIRFITTKAAEESYPTDRLTAAHADLGCIEWPDAKELANRQVKHYGLRFLVEQYRNKDGENPTLLDYVRKRGKWPSSSARYCTSEFKRAPCGRILTKVHRELGGRTKILNIFGFRAEESPARARREEYCLNRRYTTKSREVWDWLPIHGWTAQAVWDDIHGSGVPYHYAYDLGMPRLSCQFCVFAPRAALMIAGQQNPNMLREYVELEAEIGHTFQHKKPIRDI